jgi:UDP:flavonoid glycosyltransferase YjiC (YdhE family)
MPHAAILPAASVVITHAGLGTTLAALGHGVPLVCAPMGRDQFFNAEQVQALGAGRMLMPDSSSEAIAQAVNDILGNDRYRSAAKRMAIAMGDYGGAMAAATALEALTSENAVPVRQDVS